MRKFGSSLLVLVYGFFLSGAAHAASVCGAVSGNLVQNCGFETGDFSNWSVAGNLQGGVNGNYIGVDTEQPNSGTYEAYFGAQSANQQNGEGSLYGPPTTLSQAITTTQYHLYQITFYLDTNGCSVSDAGCPGYHNYFEVDLNGHQVMADEDIKNSGGLYDKFTLTGSSSNYSPGSIQFDFANDSDVFFFDDVSVRDLGPGGQTPEPATFFFVAPALAGLALVRRRRKAA